MTTKRDYSIICWETGERFENAEAAAKAVGIKYRSNINSAARSGGSAGRFHWYYADQPRPSFEELCGHHRIICYETGVEYPSLIAAAADKGLKDAAHIAKAAVNGNTAGGYHWFFAGAPVPSQAELKPYCHGKHPRSVVCWETGAKYSSIADAQRSSGLRSRACIHKAANTGGSAAGFHWYYADRPRPEASQLIWAANPQRAVVCKETGERFVSMAAAARACGLKSANCIKAAIHSGGRSGGYHWRYAHGATRSR